MNTDRASEGDGKLIRRNLKLVEGMSDRAASRVLGVAAKTVGDWRRGRFAPLRKRTRSLLLSNLEKAKAGKLEEPPEGGEADNPWLRLATASPAELQTEVMAELRRIRTSNEPILYQALARDSVASMLGAAAMFAAEIARGTAERAALARAEVLREIEANGQERMRQADEAAARGRRAAREALTKEAVEDGRDATGESLA